MRMCARRRSSSREPGRVGMHGAHCWDVYLRHRYAGMVLHRGGTWPAPDNPACAAQSGLWTAVLCNEPMLLSHRQNQVVSAIENGTGRMSIDVNFRGWTGTCRSPGRRLDRVRGVWVNNPNHGLSSLNRCRRLGAGGSGCVVRGPAGE